MSEIKNITCPNCQHDFDVEEVLANKLEIEYKQKHEQAQRALLLEFKEKENSLAEAQKAFDEKRKKENQIFKEKLQQAVELKEKDLSKKIHEDYELKMKAQQKELEEKRLKLAELKEREIEIERLKMKMGEQEKEIELKFEKKLRSHLAEKEEIIQKRLSEQNELKVAELNKKLEDQKKLVEEMRRKQEQGSMQMQGEVLELAIEQYLKEKFPLDEIREIKKGARGADCIQIVNTRVNRNCGTIYYESKRTKDFQPSWIEKFKADMRIKGADIGVIVTQALPKDLDRMGQKNGIWICTFDEFKALSLVLRDMIIKINDASHASENKGDKMEMLYGFLTSNEFKMQIEGIVEGFTQMKDELNREKNAMNRIWNSREKQLDKVLLNTTSLYGSIKGIAGKAIGSIQQLELPGSEEDEL